jgi:beta-phosphoglucomutase-like phosphatase (HAD superfamily)
MQTTDVLKSDPRIGAYIFDLDGTLIDSESLWCEALVAYLSERGKQLTLEQARAWVLGRAWHDIYRDVLVKWPDIKVDVIRMAQEVSPYYLAIRGKHDIRIHSSIEMLRNLAAHTPVSIVSGSQNEDIAEAIELMDVAAEVSFYLGSSDYSPGKPHPICFLSAAERFGVSADRCVVFEDSTAGILAGRRAGMHVVALARLEAPGQDTAPADLVVSDLAHYSPGALFEAISQKSGG